MRRAIYERISPVNIVHDHNGRMEAEKLREVVHGLLNYRMPEYVVRKQDDVMVDSLATQEKIVVDEDILEEGYFRNLRRFLPNCYRGAADGLSWQQFEAMAKAGIKDVFFLTGVSGSDEEACEKYGINAHGAWHMSLYDDRCVYRQGENFREYIDDMVDTLAELSVKVKRGGVYIGCEVGTKRTDNALALLSWVCPEFSRPKRLDGVKTYEWMYADKITDFLDALSAENKQKLEISEEREVELRGILQEMQTSGD